MVARRSVRIDQCSRRIDVNDRLGEVRNVVEELVVSHFGDLMRRGDRRGSIDAEPNLGKESVPGPAGPDLGDRHHAVDRPDDLRNSLDDGRVHRIQ